MNNIEDIYGNIYEDISLPNNEGYNYKKISMKHNKDKLKDIALELLEKYYLSEKSVIFEYSGNIIHDLKDLEKQVQKYRNKINKL